MPILRDMLPSECLRDLHGARVRYSELARGTTKNKVYDGQSATDHGSLSFWLDAYMHSLYPLY